MMKPMRYHPVRPSAFTGFGFEAVMQTPTYRFRSWHDSASLLAPSTPSAPARTRSGGAA